MTPEQTLEWLAQQHFDQCQEERPIQDWIRKMKAHLPEQPEQEHEFENWLKNQFEWKNFYYKGTGPSEMAVNFAKKAFNAGQSMVNPYVPTERQRAWVGLTDDEINQAYADSYKGIPLHEGIEAKLKEKNERKEQNT